MASKTFTTEDPALPMNYPGFVFRALRNDGYEAGALLVGTGLKESHLKDPHFRCGYEALRRFYLNALEQTGDPHLGIRLALRFDPTYIGLPAYAAMNAARFRDALSVLNRFFFLTFPAIEFTFPDNAANPRPGEAAIRLRPKLPLGNIAYFACTSALIACHGLCKWILRTDQVALRAEATISEPEGWSTVAAQVGFPVRLGASENRLMFPKALLNRPLPGADPINHSRLLALCKNLAAAAAFETTVVNQVMAFIEKEQNLGARVSAAAAALGYSERSLRRQLEQSGTSYRNLVDQVRERRAREMLAGSGLPVQAIAYELGFETPSNFARSFKRWTGTTPTAYREGRKMREDRDSN